MRHRWLLRIDAETGALQRILIAATRRGFEPVFLSARKEGDAFRVELEVEGERSAAVLEATLRGLASVTSVEART